MPADRATLLALAARAEAGGDDKLSDDCWRALGWVHVTDSTRGNMPRFWHDADNKTCHYGPRPDLRHSLDAQDAVGGLVTETRGTFSWDGPYEKTMIWHWWVVVWIVDTPHRGYCRDAPTEALARLAAKLRALAAATLTEDTR